MSKMVVDIATGIHGGGLVRTGDLVQVVYPSGKAGNETIEPMELYGIIEENRDFRLGNTYILPIGAVVKFFLNNDEEITIVGREEALNNLAPTN